MNRSLFTLLLCAAFPAVAGEVESTGSLAVGEPTVFWHEGQWQVKKDGKWVDYAAANPKDTAPPTLAPEELPTGDQPEEKVASAPPPEPPKVEEPVYDDPPIMFPISPPNQQPEQPIRPAKPREDDGGIGIGRPNTGIGQPNTGIGQPNTGIGQPTIGIGQPNPIAPPRR